MQRIDDEIYNICRFFPLYRKTEQFEHLSLFF